LAGGLSTFGYPCQDPMLTVDLSFPFRFYPFRAPLEGMVLGPTFETLLRHIDCFLLESLVAMWWRFPLSFLGLSASVFLCFIPLKPSTSNLCAAWPPPVFSPLCVRRGPRAPLSLFATLCWPSRFFLFALPPLTPSRPSAFTGPAGFSPPLPHHVRNNRRRFFFFFFARPFFFLIWQRVNLWIHPFGVDGTFPDWGLKEPSSSSSSFSPRGSQPSPRYFLLATARFSRGFQFRTLF